MVAGTTSSVFINEFHYDNSGTDSGEFVEIANPLNLDLTGWTLVLYNGGNGQTYNPVYTLSGNASFFTIPTVGIQNGAPDGFALVDAAGNVVQFLSYEGSFTATNGPAIGLASTAIGVTETGVDPANFSIQLTGSGTTYGDFTWAAPSLASPGAVNTGETFGGPVAQPGTLSVGDAAIDEGDSGTTALTFTVTRDGGSDGAVGASWQVVLGAAADAGDFAGPLAGTVAFADGQTSAEITILLSGDTQIETSEGFSLVLSDATGGAAIGDASATGTIRDDDAPPAPLTVFFNEFHYDNAGTDAGEAIEIAGLAGTDLAGWKIVFYNGNGGTPYGEIALSGIIAEQQNGFGTLSFAAPGLQNGAPDGFALVDAGGQVVQFLSYEGEMTATSGPAAGMTSQDVGVVENGSPAGLTLQLAGSGSNYEDFQWVDPAAASFGGVNAGQAFVAPNPNGSFYIGDVRAVEGDSGTTAFTFLVRRTGGTEGTVTVDYALRPAAGAQAANSADFSGPTSGTLTFAAGQMYAQVTISVIGDTLPEPTEFFALALSNPTGGADIRDALGNGTIVNDEELNLSIGAIQGAGHASAYADNVVTTRGIVTATTANGFYLQDAAGDGDAATSDAIFVFTGSAPTVVAGDGVTVRGTVVEFLAGGSATNLTTTELTGVTVTVESQGNALPAALLIGPSGIVPPSETIDDDGFAVFDPESDGIDFWESLEGMRVTIENPVAIDSTSSFGELWTAASDGAGTLAASNVSGSGLLVVEGGAGNFGDFNQGTGSDFNPERIQIDVSGTMNGQTFVVPDVTPGAMLGNVTGIVEYSFGNFEVRPTEEITVVAPSANLAESTSLVGAANQLTIATYNVLNLDINEADGDQDIASGRFAQVAYDIGVAMNAPGIVILEEIQDDSGSANDGTVTASQTLQQLCDTIFAQTGVLYSYIDNPFVVDGQTGGQPGGNIRVCFLYRADTVTLDPASVFTITDPADGQLADAFMGSRAPLGATFGFNGEEVTVIGNHWTSKIGSETTFTADQLPLNSGELIRAEQAAAVNAYIDAMLASDPNANIVVGGDFNEFHFEEPMDVLSGALDYSGGAVTPGDDQVLTNLNLLLAANERYSTIFEGNAQQIDHLLATGGLLDGAAYDIVHLNSPLGSATSDHDPVLTRLNLGTQTIAGANGAETLAGNDGNDIVTGANGDDILIGYGGNDRLSGDNGNDRLSGGAGDDVLSGGRGDDTLDGGLGHDILTGGQGNDLFVIHADGSAADADVIADFNGRGMGSDRLQILGAEGRAVTYVQSGTDTLVYADDTLVATLLGTQSNAVSARAAFVGAVAGMPAAPELLYAGSDIGVLGWHPLDQHPMI